MTIRNAPPHHVWDQVEPYLWKCRYCRGHIFSKSTPDQEAHAMREEIARRLASQESAQSTKDE